MAPMAVKLFLNGAEVEQWVAPSKSLLDALREDFGAVDVKYGCGEGVCGTCTVLLDGEPVNACLIYAVQVNGHRVTTLRGLAAEDGDLHPIQEAFLDSGGAQCGFCTPGMVLTAWNFVERHGRQPQREEIREALAGNLCRCTGYTKILDSVERYAAARFPGGDRAGDPGDGDEQ